MGVKTSDVIIMGGGIMGCSMAYQMAQKGLKVILLERGRVGEEASGRNGGGIRQQNRHPSELPLATEAVKLWASMKEELDWDVGYRVNGNLQLVTSEAEHKTFRKIPIWEKEMGLEVEFISADEARCLVPTLSKDVELLGATYCPTDGTANPMLATKAISKAALRAGAEIKEYEPVSGLRVEGKKVVKAQTKKSDYAGQYFINAAGPWAHEICNWVGLNYPITVKRSQIFVTEAVSPIIKQFVSFDVGYLRQAIEGNIHLGIKSQPVENFDKRSTVQAFRDLGHRLPQLFPFLRQINIIRAFAGITHWTPDAIPILDKAPDLENFFLTAGFSGHGFCLGPIVGRLLAEWIVDGQSSIDLNPFRWTRFEDIYVEPGQQK